MRLPFFLVTCLYSMTVLSQGAWTKGKNEVYSQLSYYTIGAYSDLYGSQDSQTERIITDNTIQLYAEYGLTDKTTLLLSLPIKSIKTGALVQSTAIPFTVAGSETSLGNITLGAKHSLYNKKWTVSAQFNVEANTGKFFAEKGIRTGYDTWTLMPKINVGRGFDRFFVQGSTGVDIRFNGYSSNFRLGGEIGAQPFKGLWVIGLIDYSISFKNGTIVLPTSNLVNGLYVNDQEFTAYGIKAIADITKNFGLLASFTGAFSGNNVPKKSVLGFGLFAKF